MSDLVLKVTRVINAPIESVYNAWLNPDMLAKFMIPGEGMGVSKAEADAVVGGRYSVIMIAGDKEIPHGGEYQKLVPHTQIVFTWESPFSVPGSTVTLDLQKRDDGTHLTLTHIKFADEESRSNHEGGWTAIVGKLDALLASSSELS